MASEDIKPPRTETVLNAPERILLEAFLDDHRDAILAAADGLTDEQARRKLVPSLTTVLGLIKHACFVEQVWFQVSLAGRTRAELGIPTTVDPSFVLDDGDTIASLCAEYRQACLESRAIAAAYELDDQALHNRRGPLSLRWVYVHVIRELAQHCGHADILREQILAADAG